jgi:helicase SWR1
MGIFFLQSALFRMLDNVVIQEGGFTEDYFQKNDWWKDLPEVVGHDIQHVDYEQALLEAEDENDAAAAIAARKEMNIDDHEFEDTTRQSEASSRHMSPFTPPVISEPVSDDEDMQLDVGHVDQYMLQFWEREMMGTELGFGGF